MKNIVMQPIIDFFNNLPEVLQESPALYVTVVCLAASFMWLKMPGQWFPASMRYPFVWTVGEVVSLSVIHPAARAFGMGFIYAAISIASFTTVMQFIASKEKSLGLNPDDTLPDLRNLPPVSSTKPPTQNP